MTVAVENCLLLAGDDLTEIPEATVVFADGIVAAAGRGVTVPQDAEVIDAHGAVLAPGFIDAHVHIAFFPPRAVVAGGITTARDLGWPPEEIHPLARRSTQPGFDGPKIVAAGPILTVERGYPTRAAWAPPGTARVVGSTEDGRQAVREVSARGSCAVKVALNAAAGPTLPRPWLEAIVEQAHAEGLKVTAHITGLDELAKAVEAGVDESAHMLMSTETIPAELLSAMVSGGMTVVPTLSCRFGRDLDVAVTNLESFAGAGGRVVYGTDLGNQGPRPGIDAREIAAMKRAGFSPRDIISSATTVSADWLGLPDRGAIEAGRAGDAVLLDPSCLRDAKALTHVRAVWRDGVRRR